MATPTHEEIQDFYKEETEYQTAQEQFEEDYPEIVVQGNEDDNDDDGTDEDNTDDEDNEDGENTCDSTDDE